MSKRIEQSRRRGHHDPRYLVLVPRHLPTAPSVVPQETFTGHASVARLPQQAPPGTEESVQLW